MPKARRDMDSREYYHGVTVTSIDGRLYKYDNHPDGHMLYCIWDDDDVLLYIGIATCRRPTAGDRSRDEIRGRIEDHTNLKHIRRADPKNWGDRVHRMVVTGPHPGRAALDAAETAAIAKYKPLFNTAKVPVDQRAEQAQRQRDYWAGRPVRSLLKPVAVREGEFALP